MSWGRNRIPERVTLPWLRTIAATGPWTHTAALLDELDTLQTGADEAALPSEEDRIATLVDELRAGSAASGARLDDADLTPSAATALERALGAPPEEGPALRVALVGGFSSGKSSLLNALVGLGSRLPAEVEPTTGCLTELHHGDSETIDQQGTDDQWSALPAPALADALRGLGPDAPRRVRIHLPHPLLSELVLVDTPGVGSEHPDHLERVDEELGRCDAALMICDATRAGSEDEAQLLARLSQQTGRTWIVLSMVDKVRVRRRGPSREAQLAELESDLRERFRGNLAGVVACSTMGTDPHLPGIDGVREVLMELHAERHQRRVRVRAAREQARRDLRSKAATRVTEERQQQGRAAVQSLLKQMRTDWRDELRVLRLKPAPCDPPSAEQLAPTVRWLQRLRGDRLQIALDTVHIVDTHEYLLRSPSGVTWRHFLLDLARLASRPARWTPPDGAARDLMQEVLLHGDDALGIDLPARFHSPCSAERIWRPMPCAGLPWSGAMLGTTLRAERARWVDRLTRWPLLSRHHRDQLRASHEVVSSVGDMARASVPADLQAGVHRLSPLLSPSDRLSLRPLKRWAFVALGMRVVRLSVGLVTAFVVSNVALHAAEQSGLVAELQARVGEDSRWMVAARAHREQLQKKVDEVRALPEVEAMQRGATDLWQDATEAVTRWQWALWGRELPCDAPAPGGLCAHALHLSDIESLLDERFVGGPRVPAREGSTSCVWRGEATAPVACVTWAEAEQLAASTPGWRLPTLEEAQPVVDAMDPSASGARAFWTTSAGKASTRAVAEGGQQAWQLAEETRIETIGVLLVRESEPETAEAPARSDASSG